MPQSRGRGQTPNRGQDPWSTFLLSHPAGIATSRPCSSIRRRRGGARLRDRAHALAARAAARRGFRRRRSLSEEHRAADDGVLRLRAALARAFHRAGLLRLQSRIHPDPSTSGRLPGRRQSGGADQRLPGLQPPAVPSLYAFSYTVPAASGHGPSFVVAGGGEAPEGKSNYPASHIVKLGDVSREAIHEKLRYVANSMRERLAALGFTWRDALETQAYTAHDIGPFIAEEIVQHGAAPGGLTWHLCRPPIVDLECDGCACAGLRAGAVADHAERSNHRRRPGACRACRRGPLRPTPSRCPAGEPR